MISALRSRRALIAWQLIFLLLGTTWLWAPLLNSHLSPHTSLISQYETASQPYAWAFRLGDMLAGGLLMAMGAACLKQRDWLVGWVLIALGVGFFVDPLIPTTCSMRGAVCSEYVSASFVIHAIETVLTAFTLFGLSAYDAWLRKKLVSLLFTVFQIGYGILFLTQLAHGARVQTLTQFIYQTIVIAWIAWFCQDYDASRTTRADKKHRKIVKRLAAAWAFINGILAIVISLAHIHLLGRVKDFYFAGDTAWLAQHGVIVGVTMLYLSRHLLRGELRARQIFLIITGLEAIKYSVITPHASLLLLYMLSFGVLFVLRDDFDRGHIAMTWRVRLRDVYFMIGALLTAGFVSFLVLDRDNKISIIAGRSLDNFFDYVARSNVVSRSHLASALLAHTITAFIVTSLGAILWILFRPYKSGHDGPADRILVKHLLQTYGDSSEDYFKLWPEDKTYFWQDESGFIAYRRVGPIAFALANPISDDRAELLRQFITWAKSRRLRVCFLPVAEKDLELYRVAGLETQQIGSSALVPVDDFLSKTAHDKWWRWQKNRAAKQTYTHAISSPPHAPALLKQFRAVSGAWLETSGHREQGFALGYYDESYLNQCTINYLKDSDGKLIAFTNLLPQLKPLPTFTIDLLRYLPEASHPMPYLLYKTIESSIGYKYFDLGFVPFAKAQGPLLKIARLLSQDRFSSQGLEQFKNKFDPTWQPNFVAYEGDLADLALIALHLEKLMSLDA